MNPDKPKQGTQDQTSKKSGKKKYQRPEILYREPLEAMAALCVPRPPAKANVGTCPLAQRS